MTPPTAPAGAATRAGDALVDGDMLADGDALRITSAVLREKLASIVREMRRAMIRSSYSSIIYEGYDFSCVLLDGDGRLVAESGEDHPFHIIPVADAVVQARRIQPDLGPDDILLHNDPYTGGTHLNDVAVIWPMFRDGAPVFHIVIRAHWGDIGGMSPGSLNGSATDILQEGLRLNYIRVSRSAASEVMRLIFDNVRVTDEASADFRTVLGICRVAETRLDALLARYGAAVMGRAVDSILDESERRIRAGIRALPDGTWRHVGYLDGNAATPHPLRVAAAMTVAGDRISVDFTGSSPQVAAPLNAGPAIARTSVLTVLKSFLDPRGAITSGTLRAIEVHAPEGTIVNARAPAPCGGLNEVRFACDSALMGALGQVIPERMTGEVRGTSNHTYVGTRDFVFYEYPSGGTGAWARHDGNPAVRAFNEGENVSIQSAEIVERVFPLRIRRCEIRADSGGPGRFRGGPGLLREVEIRGEGMRLSVLSDRNIVPPAGVNGGRSGAPNRYAVLRDGREIDLGGFPGKLTNIPLQPGDVLRMESSGGGGFGPPEDRSPEALARDLADGYVTEAGTDAYRHPAAPPRLIRGADLQPGRCRVPADLARAGDIAPGDLVEVTFAVGPPMRLWVAGLAGAAVEIPTDPPAPAPLALVRLSTFGRGRANP